MHNTQVLMTSNGTPWFAFLTVGWKVHLFLYTPSSAHTRLSTHPPQHTPSSAHTLLSTHPPQHTPAQHTPPQHTPSSAHTLLSTHPPQHTPSSAHTLLSTHPPRHTPSSAHTLLSTHPPRHTPSSAHTLLSTHPPQHTPSSAHTLLSTHPPQHTPSSAHTLLSTHPPHTTLAPPQTKGSGDTIKPESLDCLNEVWSLVIIMHVNWFITALSSAIVSLPQRSSPMPVLTRLRLQRNQVTPCTNQLPFNRPTIYSYSVPNT